MSDAKRIHSALNIMRRMPPPKIPFNVSALVNLMPDETEELLQRIDQPLRLARGSDGKLFALCDYNRDGDSYRSPWTNTYEPPLEDGFKPSARLRDIEQRANLVFDTYRALYYEGGCSSVYVWDLETDDGAFAACFVIKKEIIEPQRRVSDGTWDSIHVIEVKPLAGGKAAYKVVTTIILQMRTSKGNAGDVLLSGSFTRQAKDKVLEVAGDDDHVINMGKIIEEIEISVRGEIEGLYLMKTREIVNNVRKPAGLGHARGGIPGGPAGMMSELGTRLKGQSVAGRGIALPGLGGKS